MIRFLMKSAAKITDDRQSHENQSDYFHSFSIKSDHFHSCLFLNHKFILVLF